MSLEELAVTCRREIAPRVEALLEAAGAVSVSLADAADEPLYEPGPDERPLWRETRVRALFANAGSLRSVLDGIESALGAGALRAPFFGPVPERDWVRETQDAFEPRRFGRLWVCPTWSDPPRGAEAVLRLDPGLAFGTGSHPTTALCLEWLAAAPLDGATVLDYGCGSGILAVGAALLGAACCHAVDHDPQALAATRANAAANGVAGRVDALAPEALPPLAADVVVANILAGPLVSLAGRLAAGTRAGGRVALSGILGHQAAEVGAAYRRWFRMDEPVTRGDWVLLSGTRTAHAS